MSIFDEKEPMASVKFCKYQMVATGVAWAVLSVMVSYVRYTQTKPEQRDLIPYEFLITLVSVATMDFNHNILEKVKTLRVKEKAGHDTKELAKELRDTYDQQFTVKMGIHSAFFLSVGLATPPMLKEAFAGQFPWSEVAEYMLILAFLGTISGMVLMSLNYPFIIHTVSYTLSLPILLGMGLHEHGKLKSLRKWSDSHQKEQLTHATSPAQ